MFIAVIVFALRNEVAVVFSIPLFLTWDGNRAYVL